MDSREYGGEMIYNENSVRKLPHIPQGEHPNTFDDMLQRRTIQKPPL